MTVKITITCIDKLRNQQKRYSKYLQWGDAFAIALQEVPYDRPGESSSEAEYVCLLKNKDGEVVVQKQSSHNIYLNAKTVENTATIKSGDMMTLTPHINFNFKIYELTGRDLFRSTRSSKEPIVVKIAPQKKAAPTQTDHSNPVGNEIDGYYFEDVLNYGSMGIVYKGIQKSLNRQVAIKTVAPKNLNNPTLVKRFMNMANLAWRLNHPYIVQIFDTGISQEFRMHYVVMEYVEGETLRELLQQKKKLDIDATCKIISQLASALSFAHRQNIIHRDVNPTNIILTKNDYIKLVGLALSKIVDPDEERIALTVKGQAMGTMGYISPEQAKSASDVDYRTDIYSLGVIFYECLCGQLPYDPEVLKDPLKYVKVLRQRPKNLPHKVNPLIPEPLSKIVMKCLEPNPAKRYQKSEEVLQDIKVYTESKLLSVAQKRIRAMFPRTPKISNFEFHVTFEPMEKIGGDFYDFVLLDEKHLGIVIGDVTGHGVEAAVVMGMVKSIVKVMAKNIDSPTQVLEYANTELSPDMDTTTFTTIAYGVLDVQKKTFTFSRAGHNPLILYNVKRDPRLISFSPKGTIVGVPWALNCEEVKIPLQQGDILIQFTDGITECTSKKGEEFGFERLCEVIEQTGSNDLEGVISAIKNEVASFSQGSLEDADDVTIVAFKVV